MASDILGNAARTIKAKLKSSELLPAAIGAVGVVYYALDAASRDHGPGPTLSQWLNGVLQAEVLRPSPDSPMYEKKIGEWGKHVETGQLVATVALAAGMLVAKLRGTKKR
jgi:hypothetical protein